MERTQLSVTKRKSLNPNECWIYAGGKAYDNQCKPFRNFYSFEITDSLFIFPLYLVSLNPSFFNKSTKPLVIVSCLCGALVAGCAGDGPYVDPYQARARREAAMQQQGGGGQDSANATRRDVMMPAMSLTPNHVWIEFRLS